jgi:hypothetical protein
MRMAVRTRLPKTHKAHRLPPLPREVGVLLWRRAVTIAAVVAIGAAAVPVIKEVVWISRSIPTGDEVLLVLLIGDEVL